MSSLVQLVALTDKAGVEGPFVKALYLPLPSVAEVDEELVENSLLTHSEP